MGGRKFVVTVVAIFSLFFMSLPVYAGYYYGNNQSITGTNTNEYGITAATEVTLTYEAPGTVAVLFETSGEDDLFFDKDDVKIDPITSDPILPIIKVDNDSGKLTFLDWTTPSTQPSTGIYGTFNITWPDNYNPLDPPEPLDEVLYSLEGSGWSISGTLGYTEIPIPAAIWLLGSGMIGLAGLRRRFRTSE